MALPLADRLAIEELTARYNHAADLAPETWPDYFTADGVFEAGPEPRLLIEGGEALRRHAGVLAARTTPGRHWTNNAVIRGDGDAATQTCYFTYYRVDYPPFPVRMGVYRDTLARIGGEWRFKERRLTYITALNETEQEAERTRLLL